jgi:hypothetical protein
MRRRRTPEDRYKERVRKQQQTLEEFAAHEIEWANDLMLWYRVKKLEMPEDEYRGCCYFINREFSRKQGSLTLVYEMYKKCREELPQVTSENAFDILRFTFRMYAQVLIKGGYGG